MSDSHSTEEDLNTAISALVDALTRVRHIAFQPGAIAKSVFYGPDGGVINGDSAELFVSAISKWDIPEDAEHGNVFRFPGVIEASTQLIAALAEMNLCKARFEDAAKRLDAQSAKDRQVRIRATLKAHGLGVAHPLQCWRQVHLLPGCAIKTIGFSLIKSSFSSETVPFDKALARLRRMEAQDVIEEIEALDGSWTQARWVKPVSAFIRANVSYWEGEELVNITPMASLPIVVEEGHWPKLVKFNIPKDKHIARMTAKPRTERKIALSFLKEGTFLALT